MIEAILIIVSITGLYLIGSKELEAYNNKESWKYWKDEFYKLRKKYDEQENAIKQIGMMNEQLNKNKESK